MPKCLKHSILRECEPPFNLSDEEETGGSTQRPLRAFNSKPAYIHSNKIQVKGDFQTLPEELMSGRVTERKGPEMKFAWAQEESSLAHSGLEEVTPQRTQDERILLQQSVERSIERLALPGQNSAEIGRPSKKIEHLKTLQGDEPKSPKGKDTGRRHSNYPSVLPWDLN